MKPRLAPSGPIAQLLPGWQRLRLLYGESTNRAGALIGASIMAGFAEAVVLALVANVATAMVIQGNDISTDVGPLGLHLGIGSALALALGVAVFRLLLQLVVTWLPAQISADVQATLRRELLAAFTQASWQAQTEDHEGHLQELMTSQINQTTQVVLLVVTGLSGSAMFLALTIAALLLSPLAALTILGAAILLFFLLRPLARHGRMAGRELSRSNIVHASGVGETVRLAEEAHVFGTNDVTRDRIGQLISATHDAFFRFQLLNGLVRNVYQSLVVLLLVIGLLVLYLTGAGDLAVLGAVVLMLVRASTYAQQFQNGYQALNQLLPYLERIQDAIARYAASVPRDGDQALPPIQNLAFEKVGFSYRPGLPVLRDITFAVEAGESIGVIGPSGAGKSTVVQLLLRLREVDTGSYLVNGRPAASFRRRDWQQKVAYVAQEPRVMRGTVAENIRFFRPITDAAVERAARLAHIHDDIVALPDGYDTMIGQVADAVSGGQRQRICLARGLAGAPEILVLDEPTSALDMASEVAVQASLTELHGHVTSFVIAHRLSTLSECDRVLVLSDGHVEAFATATELETHSDYYRSTSALARRTR